MIGTLVNAAASLALPDSTIAARRFNLELKYEGSNISLDVAPFIESFSYADRTLANAIDEISVTFQDVDGLWRGGWFPRQGAKFSAKFSVENWFNEGDCFERDCGVFEIDDLTSSGLPSVFTIKAISVGVTNSIRKQQNTKSWEKAEIKAIANDIASKHGFELKWYSNYNPVLERWEQKSESDLSYLKKICEYAGLMIKITDKAIVIFRSEQFDSEKPEIKIRISGDGVKSYNFNANVADVYSACEVKYFDPKEKKLIEYLYAPDGISGVRGGASKQKKQPGSKQVINQETRMVETQAIPQAKKDDVVEITEPEVGQVLKVNRIVSSIAEAEEVAKAALRSKNMRQLKGSMALIGRPDYYSGLNFKVQGLGVWDSPVFSIEEALHSYDKGSGYNTAIQFRGILGY